MVTKLKRFSLNRGVKAAAIILAVAAITAAAVVFQLANLKAIDKECVFVKDYSKSKIFLGEAEQAAKKVEYATYCGSELIDVPFLYYGVNNKEKVVTNVSVPNPSAFLENMDNLFMLRDGVWRRGDTETGFMLVYYASVKNTAYLAFSRKFMNEKQQEWNFNRDTLIKMYIFAGGLLIFGLLLVSYLIAATGRRFEDRNIHTGKLGRIYSDIILAAICLLIYYLISHIDDFFNSNTSIGLLVDAKEYYIRLNYDDHFTDSIMLFTIVFAFFGISFITLLLTLVRKLKAGILIRHSLIYNICRETKRLYTYIFYGDLFPGVSPTKTLYYRQSIVFVSSAVLYSLTILFAVSESILFIIPVLLEILVFFWYSKGNGKILENIDGNIKISLDEMLKAERTKVALITNVSHDLKTPLTSIISYIDLLSKEEGLSETSLDYIKILRTKSDRLKNIVTDLFDLAKSSGGDIAVENEVIDLKKLMEQTLAELEDQIALSQLQVRTKYPDTPVYVKTDGKKLYRVFQNIIDNALKYSLTGTRIYIELETEGDRAVVSVKNVAGYEMNFTEEEILQRFYRGDQSRSTEGSGLGLSIAESFTRVCGGKLSVDIDGDLFKVVIRLKQYSE